MAIVRATVKGQVVIPAKLRKKYGITKGSRVSVSEAQDQGVIILRPLPEDPITASRGMLRGETSILKSLLRDRKEEAERG
jgi:AbrB family looped-hinge helix DNA binding protein